MARLCPAHLLPLAALLAAAPSLADRGALSFDVAAGPSFLSVEAPYVPSSSPVLGTAAAVSGGSRYALTNQIEVAISGFYEWPASYTHRNVTVVAPGQGAFPGAETHDVSRYGILAGPHLVFGSLFRFTVGLELGWCHAAYSNFHAYGYTPSGQPFDYGLSLPDVGRDGFALVPLAGVEWVWADHWSASVLPRLEFVIGPNAVPALTVPVVVSYHWYL